METNYLEMIIRHLITVGGGFPGLLDGITSDAPTMTVQHFTGSRTDKTIQLIKITGEVEGYT